MHHPWRRLLGGVQGFDQSQRVQGRIGSRDIARLFKAPLEIGIRDDCLLDGRRADEDPFAAGAGLAVRDGRAGRRRLDTDLARDDRINPLPDRIVRDVLSGLLRDCECLRILLALRELIDLRQRLFTGPSRPRVLPHEPDGRQSGCQQRDRCDCDPPPRRRTPTRRRAEDPSRRGHLPAADLGGDVVRRNGTPRRLLFERPLDDANQGIRRIRTNVANGHRVFRCDCQEHRRHRRARERQFARQHLVECHAESPHVGTRVDVDPRRLFGSHVGHRAQRRAGRRHSRAGLARFREHHCQAEIDDLYLSVIREHDIGWFEIAMHDTRAVRGGQTGRDLSRDARRFAEGERTALDARAHLGLLSAVET